MSAPEFIGLEDIPYSVADEDWYHSQQAAYPEPSQNGAAPASPRPWRAEPWSEFRDTSDEDPRWLIRGLLPEGALAFIAAPPKKGKTWVALAFGLSIATGLPLFGEYQIEAPRDTLYVALEGSRSAIRARTGSLCRGLGVDPDGDDLEHLHLLYRPRPFDLARSESAQWLLEEQEATNAAFIVVDVLRAAARFRENVSEDFAVVRDSFEPLLDRGCTVAVLHHFGKLTDTQGQRSPGERMAGTGAMYGALDVGFLITRSEQGARRLRLDIEARDFAAPDALGVVISGTGSGEHGGFRYTDTASFVIDAAAAEDRDLVAELEQLFSDGQWRTAAELATKATGIGADRTSVTETLTSSPDRFCQVTGDMALAAGRKSKSAKPWGTIAMRDSLSSEVVSGVKPPKQPDLFEGSPPGGGEVVVAPKGATPPAPLAVEGGSALGNHHDHLDEDPGF